MNQVPGIVIHIVIFTALLAWFAWLIASAWRRRQKAQVQNHLLDRFSSAADLAAFLETDSGRAFMAHLTDRIASPAQTVVNSVRIGVLLVFAGIGILLGAHVMSDTGPVLTTSSRVDAAGALVIVFLGFGFMVSAWISLRLSRRLSRSDKEANK